MIKDTDRGVLNSVRDDMENNSRIVWEDLDMVVDYFNLLSRRFFNWELVFEFDRDDYDKCNVFFTWLDNTWEFIDNCKEGDFYPMERYDEDNETYYDDTEWALDDMFDFIRGCVRQANVKIENKLNNTKDFYYLT